MALLLIIATVVLGIILYMMLGKGEKAYAYSSTVMLYIDKEGFEQADRKSETGMVFITRRGAIIDGEVYPYKKNRRNKHRAKLQYDGNILRSVSIRVAKGEKIFYVQRLNALSKKVAKSAAI